MGRQLFQDAILKAMRDAGVTVILVTHALHFLSQCDYVYTINNGRITEQGTYKELIANAGEFARLDKEFGGISDEEVTEDLIVDAAEIPLPKPTAIDEEKISKLVKAEQRGAGSGKAEGQVGTLLVSLSISITHCIGS